MTPDLLELRNIAVVADLVIRCGLARKESRGLHYTADWPRTDPSLAGQPTFVDGDRVFLGRAPAAVGR